MVPNEEVHDFYSSKQYQSDQIEEDKAYVTCGVQKFIYGMIDKSEKMRPVWGKKNEFRCENNVEMCLEAVGWADVDWINEAHLGASHELWLL